MKNRDDFWALITEANQAEESLFIDQYLISRLVTMEDEDIIRYEAILHELMAESNRWDVWAAGWVMNVRVCNDDEFEAFRGWIIAQGKEVFELAMNNPDDLADCLVGSLVDTDNDDIYYLYEEFLYVGLEAFMEKNDFTSYEEAEEAFDVPLPEGIDLNIKGTEWQETDLPAIVPKLCALFKFEPC